jgi:hypothetical protein
LIADYDPRHPRPWERHGVSEEYYNRDRDRMWSWLRERRMSFAERQRDMKDRGVQARIDGFLRCKEEAMAEQIKVVSEGEEVVLTAEGEVGVCMVRMKLEEAERFQDILDRAVSRAYGAMEAREAEEAAKISGVGEEDGA